MKKIAEKEFEAQETLNLLNYKFGTIGNLVHDSVPISNDEVCFIYIYISFNNVMFVLKSWDNLCFRLTILSSEHGVRKELNLISRITWN